MNKDQETELLQAMLDWWTAHDLHAERMVFWTLYKNEDSKRIRLRSREALNHIEDNIDALCDKFGVDLDERKRLMDKVDEQRVKPVSQIHDMIVQATLDMYAREDAKTIQR